MASVFLSYAQKDRDVARRLASDLKKQGIAVWFDKDQILAGDSILERVREGIKDADYLLVLLSEHSRSSVWVTRELETAFRIHGPDSQRIIIPIRLDDSPLPGSLSDIRYLDLREDYDKALKELLKRIIRDQVADRELTQIIDSEQFARAIARDTTARKGPEFYVSTFLGIISIAVSLFTAWPSFQTAFGRVSKVYYDLVSAAISLPPGANETKVLRVLEENGVSPAGLRIRVVNKGQVKAAEVRVGTSIMGEVIAIETKPKAEMNPVWVDIEVEPVVRSNGQGRVKLKNLVPGKPVTINVGYKPSDATYQCDVVADGLLATRVENLTLVPSWSLYQALRKPLFILCIGLLVSFAVGVIIAASRNPRLREKLIAIIEAVMPGIGRALRIVLE